MGATKKIKISVPVTNETVSETLSQLPRLPKDAGLIPLVPANLKRKMEYKNAQKTEYIQGNSLKLTYLIVLFLIM